jgi:hypothetical protein
MYKQMTDFWKFSISMYSSGDHSKFKIMVLQACGFPFQRVTSERDDRLVDGGGPWDRHGQWFVTDPKTKDRKLFNIFLWDDAAAFIVSHHLSDLAVSRPLFGSMAS